MLSVSDDEGRASRRSRRAAPKKEEDDALKAIKRLKEAREGKKVEYDFDEDDDAVYEEVDEEEYKRRQAEYAADDFVVDDDGRGYRDDGRDWMEEEHDYSGEDEAEEETGPRKKGAGKEKEKGGKKGKKDVKPDPRQRSINALFSNAAKKSVTSSAAAQAKVMDAANDDFLNSLLTDLNEDPEDKKSALKSQKKVDVKSAMDAALFATPAQAKQILQATTAKGTTASTPLAKRRKPSGGVDATPVRFKEPAPMKPAQKVEVKVAPPEDDDTHMDVDEPADESSDCGNGTPVPKPAEIQGDSPVRPSPTPITDNTPPTTKPTPSAAAAPAKPATGLKIKEVPLEEDVSVEDEGYSSFNPKALNAAVDFWAIRSQEQTTDTLMNDVTDSPSGDKTAAAKQDSSVPLIDVDGEKVLRMYWIDAVEDVFKNPGTIYLFGKVWSEASQEFHSCCVLVRSMPRNLLLLPRDRVADKDGLPTDEEVTMAQVYGELQGVMDRYGIKQWKCKQVTRKYAFETPNVPAESDYMKIHYSYNQPELPSTLTGRTFSHLFGTNSSALEVFLLKRRLMGPCWLDIKGMECNTSVTWCKWEGAIDSYKNITKTVDCPLPVPPLRVVSLAIRTVVNPKTHKHEVVSASVISHNDVAIDGPTEKPEKKFQSFSVIRPLDRPLPFDFESTVQREKLKIERAGNEKALLGFLVAKIHRIDPDVIVGHNLYGFDLDVLLHRMQDNKVAQWSKLGRLRRTQFPKLGSGGMGESTYAEKAVLAGRLGCSVYISAKELIKSKSYSMSELAAGQLKMERNDMDFDVIPKMYENTKDLLAMLRHCENDAYITISLMFKLMVLPLSKQITNLAGNVWSRTLMGGRAERNEFLLLHEFHERKFVVPDKAKNAKFMPEKGDEGDDDEPVPSKSAKGNSKNAAKKKKAAYAGGLVLEPKKGFYDTYILLLDFNSLYPSIIQEYNICFTTVARKDKGEDEIPDIPDSGLPKGVLPTILATLVKRRRDVKNMAKNERNQNKLAELDIRQRALKLTANSMYGCLGFTNSRFYAKPLAALITSKGREILENTANLASHTLNLDVIYGDTDSIMINTNIKDLAEAKKIGNKVKQEVNKLYNLLEIDIDGVYKTMLLLKKKKYAALSIQEVDGKVAVEKETKGLDIVRRDWCGLSHDVGNAVLELILSDTSRDQLADQIHEHLRRVALDIKDGRIPRERFVINKGLTKNPEDYPDKKNQPHVQVALRMKARGQVVQSRDTVPYVICVGESQSVADRAHHPDDLLRDRELKLDLNYYLKQQVHPVVARLVEPIDGTDAAQVAECLGLDPSGYNNKTEGAEEEEEGVVKTQLSDEEKYRDAERLIIKCPTCGKENEFTGPLRMADPNHIACGMVCPDKGCGKAMPAPYICNSITLIVRRLLQRYYEGWVVCDDQSCGNRTQQLSVCGRQCIVPGCPGQVRPEYTATALYTQLTYYQYLFDLPHLLQKCAEPKNNMPVSKDAAETMTFTYKDDLRLVHSYVTGILAKNARTFVDLGSLFALCVPKKH